MSSGLKAINKQTADDDYCELVGVAALSSKYYVRTKVGIISFVRKSGAAGRK